MKKSRRDVIRAGAVGLVLCASVAASPVASAETSNDLSDDVVATMNKAFDALSKKTIVSSPSFSASASDWVIPFTDDAEFIGALGSSNNDFAESLKSPRTLDDVKSGVDKITAVKLGDDVVAALPFGKIDKSDGGFTLKDLKVGDVVDFNGDSVPLSAHGLSIHALSGNKGDKPDASQEVSPRAVLKSAVTRYVDGSNVVDDSLMSKLDTNALTPGEKTTIEKEFDVDTNGQKLTSKLKAYKKASSEESDKSDGVFDGLEPIQDAESSQPVESSGEQRQRLEFNVGKDDGVIYIRQSFVDENGNVVAPEDVDSAVVAKPGLEVQASTSEGSRKLSGDEKQTVYNQARLTRLTTGKRYQVLVNLYECTDSGKCREIAAVNREIIPKSSSSMQNFSVNLSTKGLDKDKATFEWTTRVFEGTGDVKNMGKQLTGVEDHPDSQVLSFDGKKSANGSKSTNKTGDGRAKTEQAAPVGSTGNENLEVGDEAPPASMDEIQMNENVEQMQEENDSRKSKTIWSTLIVISAAALTVGALMSSRLGPKMRGMIGKSNSHIADGASDNEKGRS